MSELKPCPFCGGEPYLIKGESYFEIGCSNRKCKLNVYVGADKKKQVTAAWNKRVTAAEQKPKRRGA